MTTTPAPAAPPVASTKSFRGKFRVQRKGGGKARAQHGTFSKAEREAFRLLTVHPDAIFLILQEVASVRLRSSPCDIAAPDGDVGAGVVDLGNGHNAISLNGAAHG